MKNITPVVLLGITLLSMNQAQAYEVWMGTHLMTHAMATTNLSDWAITAPLLEGVNINRAPHDTDPASNNDWRTIIDQFPQLEGTGTAMTEIPRSQPTKDPTKVDELAFPSIDSALSSIFGLEDNFGYDLNLLMFYDNATTYPADGQRYNYNWTVIEVQHVREWLDAHGHADVQLMYDARSNSQANKDWCTNPLVDHVLIEGSTTAFLNNEYGKRSLIQWLWTDPATINKKVLLQIPRTQDSYSQYQGTRRMAVMLGGYLGYGEDGMRSDRLVFLPVTYNDNYAYIPETNPDGTLYKNTLTSICLSLIEQRDFFEGRLSSLPTNADADSYTRDTTFVNPGPTSGLVAHWPLDEGSGTVANDASGYDHSGSLLNGAVWGSDATRDSYVSFDGTDDRIATTFNYALADTNDFTWAWWANKQTPAGTDNGAIMVGNRYPQPGAGGVSYEFIKFTPTETQFANTSTVGDIEKFNYADVAQNEWHHYAMVKSGTSYQWYVDGVVQGVASNFNYSETSPIPFLIGGDGDNKPNEHFQGFIDDVILYRNALTAEEVVDVKNGNYPYAPLSYGLIAGWDTWNSATAPTASVLASNVTGAAVTTTEQQAWNITDERGASNDGTWGSFAGPPAASTNVVDGENLTLPNATTGGTITFTITNGGTDDISLGSFHFDAYAFRPKAPRTYALSVLAGSGISTGIVFTSGEAAITEVTGANANDAHDDIDLSLEWLEDHILGAGESAAFLLAFSAGAGDGSGGHHLFLDNVAIIGAFLPTTETPESPVLDHEISSGDIVFSWTGDGFKVQSRTNLLEGFWFDVPGGDTPPVNVVPSNPNALFRLIEQ